MSLILGRALLRARCVLYSVCKLAWRVQGLNGSTQARAARDRATARGRIRSGRDNRHRLPQAIKVFIGQVPGNVS